MTKPCLAQPCLARVNFTVKLARAKLPANTDNFTCSGQVKRPHTQFTCITCSLPVKPGKVTCFYAASTSCRIHSKRLQPHVNLLEYNGYFTGNSTCGSLANLLATIMQNCLLLQTKNMQFSGKNTRIEGKNPRQTQSKITAIAGKNISTCTQNYLQRQAILLSQRG